MQISLFVPLLAVSATSVVAAFQHPEGGPDGLYVHDVDLNGTVSTNYIGVSNGTAALDRRDGGAAGGVNSSGKERSLRFARASTGPVCGAGLGNDEDIRIAETGLANSFGGGHTFKSKSVSYFWGSAVAYGCNYENGQSMSSGEYLGYMKTVGDFCGSNHVGWYNIPTSKSSYGLTNAYDGFC